MRSSLLARRRRLGLVVSMGLLAATLGGPAGFAADGAQKEAAECVGFEAEIDDDEALASELAPPARAGRSLFRIVSARASAFAPAQPPQARSPPLPA